MNDLPAPSEPRLSSTVLLVRDDPTLRVLMVVRSYQIDFASGAYVFPGGKVSADDRLDGWSEHVDGEYSGDERAVRIGGLREVFEESGLLHARKRSEPLGSTIHGDLCEELAPHRGPVDRGEESFLALMQKHDLVLNLNALTPYAHWITPDMMPKRFDTRFFIAKAPVGQTACHDGRETTDAVWCDPADILAKEKTGEAKLLFPTRVNLEWLEDVMTSEAALDQAEKREIVTVLPVVQRRETGAVLVIPNEAGYRVSEEPLERVTGG